jgi:uncharacterized protein YkwD
VNHNLIRVFGAVFALSALAWTAAAPPAAVALTNCDVSDASLDGEEQAFLRLVNDYRAQNGAGPVSIDTALTRAATWMANDLASSSGFSHTDSLGRSPWARMPACGVASPGGENLAAGTHYSSASTALNAWINSPGHRAVMIDPAFGTIGIARVNKPGSHYGWYWVTDYGFSGGQRQAAAPPPPPPPPPPAAAQRPIQSAAAPAAPAPAAPPPPVMLGISGGSSLVTWDGGYRTPDEVFAGHEEQVAMVYVFDLGTETWLHWGPALDPMLRTLNELRTGVDYWVIAAEDISVPMN